MFVKTNKTELPKITQNSKNLNFFKYILCLKRKEILNLQKEEKRKIAMVEKKGV